MKEVKMKAAIYTQYGSADVLHLETINKPIPKENEVLVKIKATSVNSGDIRLRKADPFGVRLFFGLFKPKINILGSVYSGEVEAVGKSVTRFNVGDEVFGSTDMKFGSYAQYISVASNGAIALKPKNISHKEAAAIPFGGTTALFFIKKANIKSGQKVLIYGATGAVGTAAIQLAKYYGAHVTAVCSTPGIDIAKSIGADRVIDYTKEDITKNDERYDVIYDTVNKLPVSVGANLLAKNGNLILGAAGMSEMMAGMLYSMKGTKVSAGLIKKTADDMEFLKKRIEEGKMVAVIDSTYMLEQIADAHRYVEKGHKKGNVVVEI